MTTANNYDGEDFCCTDAAPCSVHQLPVADGPEPCQICGAWTYSLLCARCEALA